MGPLSWRPLSINAVLWGGQTGTPTWLTKIWKLLVRNTFNSWGTSLTALNESNPSSSKSVVLKRQCASELPGGFVKLMAGLHPQSFWSLQSAVGPGFVFLMQSQVMLMVPPWRTTILRNLLLERVNHLKSSLVIKVGDHTRDFHDGPKTMGNYKEQHQRWRKFK